MSIYLVRDPSPEWLIGQDIAGGDAWLMHNRSPRFVARVRPLSAVPDSDLPVRLECGMALTELRWLDTTQVPARAADVIHRADRHLSRWMQQQLTRVSRAA
ncbi:MAG: hypothetical protein D6685_03055 [Bacteroidetes bacterium]|nr:MAG: hypothetical protein D6685_03055 [Bacteroidota bacterium]